MLVLAGALSGCGGGDDASTEPAPPAGEAPTITQPPASQTVAAGTDVRFEVLATGTAPLSYRWKREGVLIEGAEEAVLDLPAVTMEDDGAKFTVEVSNAHGSATSEAATLTVTAPAPPAGGEPEPEPVAPSILVHPASITVAAGASARFSVAAEGSAPLSYQWLRDGTPIPGAVTAVFEIDETALDDDGAKFRVRVSNAVGSLDSNIATLSLAPAMVPPAAPYIVRGPQPVTVTLGARARFTVNAGGTGPLSYQWYREGYEIPGATQDAYELSSTAPTDNGARFSVRVSNALGTVLSDTALLTVNTPAGTLGQLFLGGQAALDAGTVYQPDRQILPVLPTSYFCVETTPRSCMVQMFLSFLGPLQGTPPATYMTALFVTLVTPMYPADELTRSPVSTVLITLRIAAVAGYGDYVLACDEPRVCDSLSAYGIEIDPVLRRISFSGTVLTDSQGRTSTLTGSLAY